MLEISSEEVDEYFSPKDFQVGQKMKLLGRLFLLYDCDGFTKEFYQKNYPEMDMKPIDIPHRSGGQEKVKKVRNCNIVYHLSFLIIHNITRRHDTLFVVVNILFADSLTPPDPVYRRFLPTMVLAPLKTLFRTVCL